MISQTIFRAAPTILRLIMPTLLAFSIVGTAAGQSRERGRNNPYSPSPTGRLMPEKSVPASSNPAPATVAFVTRDSSGPREDVRLDAVAAKTAQSTNTISLNPTEIYKADVGDVIFVNLKNSPQGSGYYTVRPDGTIDYPLAGENVAVAGQTVGEIENNLASGITLFSSPRVEVKIREYASHKITVSGMVRQPGEKNLRREAMPLYVIRAEADVDPKASRVVITRSGGSKPESHALSDAAADSVLIYPGTRVEFTSGNGLSPSTGFYYISGEINSGGQREMPAGLTLFQAVISSGGSKGSPKKAIVRRKNEKGIFTISEHNLRAIKDGKAPDPALFPGDVIEIRN